MYPDLLCPLFVQKIAGPHSRKGDPAKSGLAFAGYRVRTSLGVALLCVVAQSIFQPFDERFLIHEP